MKEEEHLRSFVELMASKGYKGAFFDTEKPTTGGEADLYTVLKGLLANEREELKKGKSLATFSSENAELGIYTAVSFGIRYDEKNGFRATHAIAERYSRSDTADNLSIFECESNKMIPPAHVVNKFAQDAALHAKTVGQNRLGLN